MRKKLLCLALLLTLTACAGADPGVENTPLPFPTAVPTPVVVPTPSPVLPGGRNPLTGMPMEEEWVGKRPVAIMLNNLKAALPQLGTAKADIIYEVLAEGGITRMLGVYQSPEGVGKIGSVRSSRTYYLELALGLDAIYLHAGGSEDAYAKIKSWNVTALDCVRGPYEGTLFWRDPQRKSYAYEHRVVTSGEKITELFPSYSFRQTHEEGYRYPQTFTEDGTPNGATAAVVTVPFSSYKTGVFQYDPVAKNYLVEEYGQAYIDGDTGEQVRVTNVLALQTSCSVLPNDDAGRLKVDLTSGGEGWFACGGKIIPIRWSKENRDAPFVYTTEDGQPLALGQGNSYVNIIPTQSEVTYQ